MAEELVKTNTVHIARTGGEILQLQVAEDANVETVLATAGLKLNQGEIISRDGSALQMSDIIKEGDILFLEQNDENGR